RRRGQVHVGLVGDETVVGRVRHLPGRVRIVIPERAVEDVVVARPVVGGQGHDRPGGRHQRDVQVGREGVREVGRQVEVKEIWSGSGYHDRRGHHGRTGRNRGRRRLGEGGRHRTASG